MSVTSVRKDPETLTMSVVASFDAPVAEVWEVWADPRKLERWWGPPSYPATVVEHELVAGGRVEYYMTGPEGDRHHGWWRVLAVEPTRRLELRDGFADETGEPDPDLPITAMVVTLTSNGDGGTTMTIESQFPSLEAMERLVAMGMEEGLQQAVAQIDGLLV